MFEVCLYAFFISFCSIREQERDWADHLIHYNIISDNGRNNGISLHSFCLYAVVVWIQWIVTMEHAYINNISSQQVLSGECVLVF